MTPALIAFLIGAGLGAVAAALGGFFSYWFGIRRREGRTAVPLVYLLLVAFLLESIGVFALVFGAFSGMFIRTLIGGIGVVFGFSIMFGTLFLAYLIFNDRY